MDTQKVTSEYRFCLANGISRNAYFYWQKKLREAACTELAKREEPTNIVPSGWMQLTPKQAQHTKESLDIEISGCHVTVNAETDPELLEKVCRVLRSL